MFIPKKKAFTLTELLVVVIVVGVLSAVAVPKFTRILETRKTAEAEDVMSSIRTEQEKRCALGKNYTTKLKNIPVSGLSEEASTGHYTYQLAARGMSAQSAADYRLKMLSYKDGRICCEGSYCVRLNKNYPSCDSLSVPPDECAVSIPCSGNSSQSCGCNNTGVQTRSCDTDTGTWGSWGACSIGECKTYSGSSTQSCGCNQAGTQTRSCNEYTGTWSGWSVCSVGDCQSCDGPSTQACGCNGSGTQSRTCDLLSGTWSGWSACSAEDCKTCPDAAKPAASQSCGNCGKQTRDVTCDPLSGVWQTGSWGACSGQGECAPGQQRSCNGGPQTQQCMAYCRWSSCGCQSDDQKSERAKCNSSSHKGSTYWSEDKCQCYCCQYSGTYVKVYYDGSMECVTDGSGGTQAGRPLGRPTPCRMGSILPDWIFSL